MKYYINKHHNTFKNTFRYKKYHKNVFKEVIHRSVNLGTAFNSGSTDIQNIRYDYSFYRLRVILWSVMIWYKRPKPKDAKHNKITSTISNFSKKAIGVIISVVILPIVVLILWAKYKNELIILWNNIFE